MTAEGFQKFRDETSALLFVEHLLWPQGVVCPHCGAADHIGSLRGQSTQLRSYKCYHCRKVFTVKSDTFFESSHIPVHKWLQAIYLCGWQDIRPSYLSRVLGVTFKTAALIIDRICYATSNSTLNERGRASLLPEHSSGHERPDTGRAGSVDEACTHVAQNKRASEVQFQRFVTAVSQHLGTNFTDQFEDTVGKIARSKLKLRVWRAARHSRHARHRPRTAYLVPTRTIRRSSGRA
jgi:transposase-like protein